MFADKTSIPYSSSAISTINNAANEDLESLKTWLVGSWLEENYLSLNVAKTHCILIGSRNIIRGLTYSNATMLSIYIGDDKLSPITSMKFLKMQVGQSLNWEEHSLTITKQV